MVPNPYTLVTTLCGDFGGFVTLDLKDTFYSIPLSAMSQEFALEWDAPETDGKQCGWIVLPPGFKTAPSPQSSEKI